MGEGSKDLVIRMVFNGSNYLIWSGTTKTAICGKGLWHHIEPKKLKESKKDKEKEGEEELSPEEEKWFQDDQVVLGALQSSLEISILEAYHYCKTAKELWETLKGVYGDTSNLTRIFEIKKAINQLHQEDMEFKKYFGRYRALWSELDELRPATMDPLEINKRKEQDKVFGLLLNINPMYKDLVQHILRGSELPTLDGVCSQIQKEQGSFVLFSKEELPTAHKAEVQKEEVAVANKAEYKPGYGRGTILCHHCKKPGHTKNQCWNLHPHLRPPPSNNYGRGGNNSNNYGRGSNGNGNYGREQPRANYGESSNAMTVARRDDDRGEIVLKKSDLESLLQQMASKLSNGISLSSHLPSDNLVVDSGASHHMISNSNLLTNIQPTLGSVKIANGDRIPIKGIGNLEVFDKKTDALYMPNFTSNLLSVKQATKDLNCHAIFSPNAVQFQDIDSGKVLGRGGTKDELYVLKNFSSSSLDSDLSINVSSFNAMRWMNFGMIDLVTHMLKLLKSYFLEFGLIALDVRLVF